MKYFFLLEGWTYERVWEFGGLWQEDVWRRKPKIEKLNIGLEQVEGILWLYEVEESVIMIEVKPLSSNLKNTSSIGQVVLKRLITAEEVIHLLNCSSKIVSGSSKVES